MHGMHFFLWVQAKLLMQWTHRLRVVHETLYQYTTPVGMSHHMACLRPLTDAAQRLISFDLFVDPAPFERTTRLDTWGNHHECFSIGYMHTTLKVVSYSDVEVGYRFADFNPQQSATVAQVQARLCDTNQLFDELALPFLQPSAYVPIHDELRAYAAPWLHSEQPLAVAAMALMRQIHLDFQYVPLSTDMSTPVLTVFHQRKGVCQDFAHLLLACFRACGLAARYVSGYLMADPPPGQPRLMGADASHAWVALWCPGLVGEGDGHGDWLELDPTNNCVAGLSHVRVAYGRDYGDVPPIQGVLHGGGAHTLEVRVSTCPI
jgi:transglutaminase-like putative cysteine protease